MYQIIVHYDSIQLSVTGSLLFYYEKMRMLEDK